MSVSTVLAGAALPSVAMAVTVNAILPLKLAGGVRLRPASCAGVSVMLPAVMVSVSPAVLVRMLPAGKPLIWSASVSLPSVSVRAGLMVSGIAVSSSPLPETLRVGVSETGVMVRLTVRVRLSPEAGSLTV